MKKQSGFTLIELMIVTIIFAIIAAAAVPSFQSMFGRKNLESVGKQFQLSLRMARAEASQRGVPVRVRPSEASDNWADGWQLYFINASGDEEIIRQFSEIPSSATFTSDRFNRGDPLIILPNGQATNVGSFTLGYNNCKDAPHDRGYQVLISGLVNTSKLACDR